jgi:hypothetical protein
VSASPPGQRLVFVGGLHRSGTTLLADVLGEHPEISALSGTGVEEDEGQHVQAVYPPARTYGGAGRFARDPAAHLTESSPLVSPQNARLVRESWTPYWDTGRRLLVEKSPPNLIRGRFLQALYPDASFVFLVRHPVAVSLATRKWRRRTPFVRLMEHWFIAHELIRRDLPFLGHVHVLKYEQLVRSPEPTLGALGTFLGLSTPLNASAVEVSHSSRYASQWQREQTSPNPWVRYRAARCVRQFGERAHTFGYDMVDLDVCDPFPSE